jgi:hypothetical protein
MDLLILLLVVDTGSVSNSECIATEYGIAKDVEGSGSDLP